MCLLNPTPGLVIIINSTAVPLKHLSIDGCQLRILQHDIAPQRRIHLYELTDNLEEHDNLEAGSSLVQFALTGRIIVVSSRDTQTYNVGDWTRSSALD